MAKKIKLCQDICMNQSAVKIKSVAKTEITNLDLIDKYKFQFLRGWDGYPCGWCSSIHHRKDLIFGLYDEYIVNCYLLGEHVELLFAGDPDEQLRIEEREYDVEAAVIDLNCARKRFELEVDPSLSTRYFKSYQEFAEFQPQILEAKGEWSLESYKIIILSHLLASED